MWIFDPNATTITISTPMTLLTRCRDTSSPHSPAFQNNLVQYDLRHKYTDKCSDIHDIYSVNIKVILFD